MVCLLRKKLSLFTSSARHKLTILTPLFRFSTQTQQKEEEDLPFIAQYLISSFGFSKERAFNVATTAQLRPIKSLERPKSVLRFLEENGLLETEIKTLISCNPQFLCSNVEKTLKPRANELEAAGFGGKTFIELIKFNPLALNCKSTLKAIQFWKKFVNNSEEALLKVIRRNPRLMNENIDKKSIPRMNLLGEYGLSDRQIAMLVMKKCFILKDLDSLKLLLEEIENFGFQKGSGMFVHGLLAIGSLRKDTLEKKFRFFTSSFGWSERDLKLAIVACPNILTVSEENLKSTMDFLITKFDFDMRSVAQQPIILIHSLKRRIIARHYVINMLKSKGLEINYSSHTVIMMPEKKFVKKFIVAYEKEMPELGVSCAALCDGKIPA